MLAHLVGLCDNFCGPTNDTMNDVVQYHICRAYILAWLHVSSFQGDNPQQQQMNGWESSFLLMAPSSLEDLSLLLGFKLGSSSNWRCFSNILIIITVSTPWRGYPLWFHSHHSLPMQHDSSFLLAKPDAATATATLTKSTKVKFPSILQ